MIYWFIGQPGSGKSTLARMLKERLSKSTIHLDGDSLREIFKTGYKPEVLTVEWRKTQTRALQRLIAYIEGQDVDVVVSTVNGYRDVRDEFKDEYKRVVEVYVTKSEDRGRESFNIKDFEPPVRDFIHLDTTGKTPDESLAELLGFLKIDK